MQPAHRLGEQVGGGVAENGERVGILRVARRQDLQLGAVRQRQPQILRHAVGLDEHRLLGELRPDRPGGVETAGAVGQLELGGVGEDDLHRRPRIVGRRRSATREGSSQSRVRARTAPLRSLGGRMIDPGLWDELHGMDEPKEIIERRFILPLAEPDLARRHGVVQPKAIILIGPPGTGTTTFA